MLAGFNLPAMLNIVDAKSISSDEFLKTTEFKARQDKFEAQKKEQGFKERSNCAIGLLVSSTTLSVSKVPGPVWFTGNALEIMNYQWIPCFAGNQLWACLVCKRKYSRYFFHWKIFCFMIYYDYPYCNHNINIIMVLLQIIIYYIKIVSNDAILC